MRGAAQAVAMSARVRRVAVTVLVMVSALSIASPAWGEPSAAERETARALLISGRDKRKSGKLAEALQDFERAHAIMHVPTTGLDLGKLQEQLGKLVEAHDTY